MGIASGEFGSTELEAPHPFAARGLEFDAPSEPVRGIVELADHTNVLHVSKVFLRGCFIPRDKELLCRDDIYWVRMEVCSAGSQATRNTGLVWPAKETLW